MAAVVIHFTGFLLIDPILGMAFGFVLLWASWGILRDAAHRLMRTLALLALITPSEAMIGVFVKLTAGLIPIQTLNFYALACAAGFPVVAIPPGRHHRLARRRGNAGLPDLR